MKKMNFKSITILFSALLIGIWSCSSPKTEEKEEMKKEIKFKVKVQEVPIGDQTAKVFHL